MLQNLSFRGESQDKDHIFEPSQEEGDLGYLLRPAYYWALIKRRGFYFGIPFVLVLSVGLGVALLWPATYASEGKILVQSQQIPTELVRPTVTSAAQERIQVIQQRTMTREEFVGHHRQIQIISRKEEFDVGHSTRRVDEKRHQDRTARGTLGVFAISIPQR